jgi:hypothetical protein
MAVNLRERIAATLDANADIRRQAELDLKYVLFLSSYAFNLHKLTVCRVGRRATAFH